RELGAEGRRADLAGLVARDAPTLALEHAFAGLGIAGDLHLGRRTAPAATRADARRNVVERDIHRAAERLEERRERPDLRAVESDRRLVHAGQDGGIPLEEERGGRQQGFDDVRFAAHPGLRLAGARADARKVRRACPLLADPVTDLARALRVEDLLTRL